MRRAMALATATAAWVLVIQVASIAMAPPVVVELAPVDVALSSDSSTVDETIEITLSPSNPALILVPGGATSATTTTTHDFTSLTIASSTPQRRPLPPTTNNRPARHTDGRR